MTYLIIAGICFFTVVGILIAIAAAFRHHYTSWTRYRSLVASDHRMEEMRDEQWDAIDDANHHPQDDPVRED